VGEGVNLEFEGLGVLALDLELGLEFFDEQLEAGDFASQLLDVGGAGGRTRWCLGVLARLARRGGQAGLKTGTYIGSGGGGFRREGFR
jgi:hypothetical protein